MCGARPLVDTGVSACGITVGQWTIQRRKKCPEGPLWCYWSCSGYQWSSSYRGSTLRKHHCVGKEKCERFSCPNTTCFGSKCFTTKLSVLVLARSSQVNSDAPDPDPCPTDLCVSPAAVAGLVASRTPVSHPGWCVSALVHAQAGGASQLTCTLVEWHPVPPSTLIAHSSQPCTHLKSQMRILWR